MAETTATKAAAVLQWQWQWQSQCQCQLSCREATGGISALTQEREKEREVVSERDGIIFQYHHQTPPFALLYYFIYAGKILQPTQTPLHTYHIHRPHFASLPSSMMSSGSSSSSTTTARSNWPPFTATQWQELEHQALIFKHMVAGVPIPPDLLFPLRRNNNLLDSNTTFTSRLFPHHHQPLSWGCFQMGLGRKIDPEPGRCRRTDGKKWRCSKEAFPDSKYCERHMHRGRNRSRKPVEVTTTSSSSSTSVNNAAIPTPILTPSPSFYSGTSTTSTNFNNALSSVASHHDHQNIHQRQHHHQYPYYNTASPLHHSFIYPHCSSSRPPGNTSSSSSLGIGIGFSSQNVENSNIHLGLDSVSYSQPDKDYRDRHYYNGLKDEVLDERAFFPEASSGALRSINNNTTDNEDDDPWRFTPLRMSNSTSSSLTQQKERNCFDLQSGHSQFFPDFSKNQHHEQPCFVLGTDFKSVRDHERAEEGPHHHNQRPLRHFFDEWPPKSSKDALFSTTTATQLSISMPCSDYPLSSRK